MDNSLFFFFSSLAPSMPYHFDWNIFKILSTHRAANFSIENSNSRKTSNFSISSKDRRKSNVYFLYKFGLFVKLSNGIFFDYSTLKNDNSIRETLAVWVSAFLFPRFQGRGRRKHLGRQCTLGKICQWIPTKELC